MLYKKATTNAKLPVILGEEIRAGLYRDNSAALRDLQEATRAGVKLKAAAVKVERAKYLFKKITRRLAKAKKVPYSKRTLGYVHLHCGFTNTTITCTDLRGRVVNWATPRTQGYNKASKTLPFSVQEAAKHAGMTFRKKGFKTAILMIKGGPKSTKQAALRGLVKTGLGVFFLNDITPIVHNGCRLRKPRRI